MSQLDHRRFTNRGGRIAKKSDQIKHSSAGTGVNLTKPLNANAQEFVPGKTQQNNSLLNSDAKEFVPGSFISSKELPKMKLNADASEFLPHKYNTFYPHWSSPHPTVYSSRSGPRFPQDHSNGQDILDIQFEAAILPTPHGVVPIKLHNDNTSFQVNSKLEDTPAASDNLEVKLTTDEPTNTYDNETNLEESKKSDDEIPSEEEVKGEEKEEESNEEDTNTNTAAETSDEPQESESAEPNITETSNISTDNTDDITVKEEENNEDNEDDNIIEPSETDVSNQIESAKQEQDKKKLINYDDGSYNPQTNQTGKKMYTKDFLLQFKELNIETPTNLVVEFPELTPSSDTDPKSKKPLTPRHQGGQNRSRERNLANSKGGKTPKIRPASILKEDNINDEISFKIQSILNKLTPNTYDKLLEKLKDIDLSIEANMEILLKIIFPKAVSEQRYCELYAKLCADMVKMVGTEPMKQFRKLLLSRCQREFENKPTVPELPPDSTEIAKMDHEEKATKIRHENLGNVKFIGELFKIHMLRENIMFYCIDSLLKSKSETDLEHMCLLITTIGKLLDRGDALNKYFDRIKTLSQDNTIVSRIKYMLMDIIELRTKKWVPRRETEGPKTIKEVHDDTDKKEKEKHFKSKEQDFNRNLKFRDMKMSPNVKATESPRKTIVQTIHKGKTIEVKEKDNWTRTGRGRGNPTSPNARPIVKTEGDSNNKFALLSESESPKQTFKQPKSKATTHVDTHPDSEPEIVNPEPAIPTTSKTFSDNDVGEKTNNILSDYFEEESPEDAVDRLKIYLSSPTAPTVIVTNILTTSYGKKDHERRLCVELLFELKEFVDVKSFEKAFDEVLQLLSDLCYDIPRAAEFTGFFLAFGVISGYVSSNYLSPQTLQDAKISPPMAEVLLSHYFKILLQKDPKLLHIAFQPFVDSIQNFLKDKNKDRFLQANGLANILQSVSDEPEKESDPPAEPEPTEPENHETEPLLTQSEHTETELTPQPESTEPEVEENSEVTPKPQLKKQQNKPKPKPKKKKKGRNP